MHTSKDLIFTPLPWKLFKKAFFYQASNRKQFYLIYCAAWVFLYHAVFREIAGEKPQREQVFIEQRVGWEVWFLSLIWDKIYISPTWRLEIWLEVHQSEFYILCSVFIPTEIHFQHYKHTNLIHQNQLSSLNGMHFISVESMYVLSASMGLSWWLLRVRHRNCCWNSSPVVLAKAAFAQWIINLRQLQRRRNSLSRLLARGVGAENAKAKCVTNDVRKWIINDHVCTRIWIYTKKII